MILWETDYEIRDRETHDKQVVRIIELVNVRGIFIVAAVAK